MGEAGGDEKCTQNSSQNNCEKDVTWKTKVYWADNIKMHLKQDLRLRADLTGLRCIPVISSYELGNEASGSTKGAEIVDGLGQQEPRQKESLPWGQQLVLYNFHFI